MQRIEKEAVSVWAARLEKASRIAVTAHVHPDGDAVGSTTAMLSFLREYLHKEAVVLLPEIPAAYLQFIIPETLQEHVLYGAEAAADTVPGCDMIICLDCNGFSRTETLQSFFTASPAVKILIDHHVGPDRDAFDQVFSETEISSTCELLYHLLVEITGGSLPLSCAGALMAGMTTDTNNFANSVYPSTFRMASELIAMGVDRDAILDNLYKTCSEDRIRLTGFALQEALRITDGGAAYIILRERDKERFHVMEGDTEGLVNIPLTIGRVRISLLLKEENGIFRVSIRSRKTLSARVLAETHFHGGGHECAAGGKVLIPQDIPTPDGIYSYIENILNRYLI